MGEDDDADKSKDDYVVPDGPVDLESEDESSEIAAETVEAESKSTIWNVFKNITGTKPLTQEDLEPAMDSLKKLLISKNVASGIVNEICKNVATKLEGQTCGTFNTVYRKVQTAMKESLTRILTPSKPRNILREIGQARLNKRPY